MESLSPFTVYTLRRLMKPPMIDRVSAVEVENLVERMQSVFRGSPPMTVIMACLSTVMILQEPEISMEQLQKGVLDISQYIYYYLTTDEDELKRGDVN